MLIEKLTQRSRLLFFGLEYQILLDRIRAIDLIQKLQQNSSYKEVAKYFKDQILKRYTEVLLYISPGSRITRGKAG